MFESFVPIDSVPLTGLDVRSATAHSFYAPDIEHAFYTIDMSCEHNSQAILHDHGQ